MNFPYIMIYIIILRKNQEDCGKLAFKKDVNFLNNYSQREKNGVMLQKPLQQSAFLEHRSPELKHPKADVGVGLMVGTTLLQDSQ